MRYAVIPGAVKAVGEARRGVDTQDMPKPASAFASEMVMEGMETDRKDGKSGSKAETVIKLTETRRTTGYKV